MKVLVTGVCGFVGHYVAEALLNQTDWEIVGLDRLDTSSTMHRLPQTLNWDAHMKRIRFVWHDLRSELNAYTIQQIGEVDIILHLAASSHVDRSIDGPMLFVQDNVVGTCNILNFARQMKDLRLFLYFSTDEVFGPAPKGHPGYLEWDRYHASNPYAAAKAGGEELTVAFQNTYKVPTVVSHCMNIVGRRQFWEKYLPLCVRKVLTGEELLIHTDPDGNPGSRFYVHASYVAEVVRHICTWPATATIEKYNIVGAREIDNLAFAQQVAAWVGKPLKYRLVDFHSSRPGHDLRYALQSTKLEQHYPMLAKFEHIERFPAALKDDVQWYIDNPAWLGR